LVSFVGVAGWEVSVILVLWGLRAGQVLIFTQRRGNLEEIAEKDGIYAGADLAIPQY
jgi:hypothetical protein